MMPEEQRLGSRMKYVAKDVLFYGSLLALNQLLAIVLLPLYAQEISKAAFAVYSILIIFRLISGACFMMGMDTAVMRFAADLKSPVERKILFTNGILSIGAIAGFIFLLSWMLKDILFSGFQIGNIYTGSYFYMIAWTFFTTINQLLRSWYRWNFIKEPFFWNVLGFFVLNLLLTGYFLMVLHRGVEGIFMAGLISEAAICFLTITFSYDNFKFQPGKKQIKQLFYFGFPFMLIMLFSAIIPSTDRLFLSGSGLNMEVLGEYAFAFRVSAIISFIFIAFSTAYTPFILRSWNEKRAPEQFSIMHSIYIAAISIGSLLLCCGGHGLQTMLGRNAYQHAYLYFPYMNLSVILYSLSLFSFIGFAYLKKSRFNLMATLLNLAVCYGLNLLLVPHWMQFGSLAAAIAGGIAMNLFAYPRSNKLYFIPFHFVRDFSVLIIGFLLCMVTNYYYFGNDLKDMVIKSIALIPLYAIIIYALLPLTVRERIKKLSIRWH